MRYQAYPELGPRLLFFSGGTALRETSQVLTQYTHNSIHLITPFDSGGSSAILRRAFGMPAVGDIRNRVMALADRSARGNPEVAAIFACRLPHDATPAALRQILGDMIKGGHSLMRRAPEPMGSLARANLRFFAEHMPEDFDLRGASIGNLILTGGYFNNERNLDAVIFLFSKLVEARGAVRPVVDADLHLAAELVDGTVILGQHLLTGKEAPPIASKVKKTWLTENLTDPTPVSARIGPYVARMIREADVICYPVGSFYSSVTANLLPEGVAEALTQNCRPKVYLPNLGVDPEERDMSLSDKVKTLLDYLGRGLAVDGLTGCGTKLLDYVILDAGKLHSGGYGPLEEIGRIEDMGVAVIETELASLGPPDRLDPRLTVEKLLSLA
jgi:CofD-related protein of GAK system